MVLAADVFEDEAYENFYLNYWKSYQRTNSTCLPTVTHSTPTPPPN